MPVPGVRPPRPGRARARPCGPRRDRRRGASVRLPARSGLAVGPALSRTRSTIWSPARRTRSRRSAATSCSMPTARRAAARYVAMRTRPTSELCFAVVGSMTDPGEAERLAAKYERGVDDAAMLAPARGTGTTSRAACGSPASEPEMAALDTVFPWLAHNAMMHLTVPHGLEQYTRRRLGHARRLPGAGRVPAGARARRAGEGHPAHRLRPAVRDAGRLAAMVHARALFRHPGQAQPWRRDRLAAQGAVRLHRGDERPRLPRRAGRLAARGRSRADRARGPDRGACRQAARHGARALHPRHASHPLRRGRLERLPAAGRPEHARLDGEQLDGRAAVPAARALRRGAAPRRARRRRSGARRARGGHARRFQPLSDARRHGRRLCDLRPGRRGAGAPAPPERHAHRPALFAAADDPQHHRRPVHAGAGASIICASSASTCSSPTARG